MNVNWFYMETEENAVQVAFARLVPPRGFDRSPKLIVDTCPYCGKTHRHSLAATDGSTIFGKRKADCNGGEYLLVDWADIHKLDPRKFIERRAVTTAIDPPIEATVAVKGKDQQYMDFKAAINIYTMDVDFLNPAGWIYRARLVDEPYSEVTATSTATKVVDFIILDWELVAGELIPEEAKLNP